jgi:hypothetical protein
MGVNLFVSPPQDLEPEKVCEWIPLEGWIAAPLPFTEVHLISPRAKDRITALTPMKDISRLPPELASQFIRRFKAAIPVRDMLGEEDAGTIIAKVVYESGRYDLVRVDMPRYRFRREKAAKRARIASVLACPYCRKGLASAPEALCCGECGRAFPFTGNSWNFLTDDLKQDFSIVHTDNVSDHGVAKSFQDVIAAAPDQLFLDMGAGFKNRVYPNLINLEIVDYPSTDLLGVGERLPILSGSIDGVYCDCVLEHVKDPFACAQEIKRVLKPGGYLHCTVPFMQPLHAYPNHFYNMTQQGLTHLFEGMEVLKVFVPEHLHPMVSISWMLKAYLMWLPDKEKRELAGMTVLDLMNVFPMGGVNADHPLCRALPRKKWGELCAGNTLIAVKPSAA